ncbi:rRNA maturation RNase YbeY [Tautonia sociabilis]|uniref:Endoribonuclease YbeY n=1 Tax=Tautonia sociabilis TaxID=2080755 RepID=A0A432MHB4_9BACT|nr:rRNA maturation RNase YbeY [Tautonia sociabilis]RUL86196.1 rRNA maturation RNase YbeY [Tautonia sociabilis]
MPFPPFTADSPDLEIELSDAQHHLRLSPEAVRAMAARVLELEGVRRGSLSIALVDNRAILEVNRRHLAHDWPTDVISFPLSDPGDPEFSGDLVISGEMAVTSAAERGLDPGAEFALYLVHGLLHLCGYDDSTEAERARMRLREDEVLSALGVSPPPREADAGDADGSSGREGGR